MGRTLRTLTLDEVRQLLDWAAREGWNPGLADSAAFHAVDPEGFIGAFVDGQMGAAIAAVGYDDAFGFIGLYICQPEFRGQGHGKAVWDEGLRHLGDRSIGLDAVPEQRSNYTRAGFAAAYETVRMTGLKPRQHAGSSIALTPDDVVDVAAFDRRYFPAQRDGFLQHWLASPNSGVALGPRGGFRGYGVVRPCQVGHKLGPFFADTVDDAVALFEALSVPAGEPVQIDVPRHQTGFMAHLEGLGFLPSFSTTRMYRGQPPEFSIGGVFGVTSLELG